MNKTDAKNYILARGKEYLTPDRCKKGYICPVCGSGSGKNGTGITTKDGIHFTCWVGCFTNADIIDIIGIQNGLTNYNEKLQVAANEFNITIESHYNKGNKQNDVHNYTDEITSQESETDYTEFFLQANKNIERTSYHRGLTAKTLNRFNVGYVENWKHPKTPNAPSSPRLIIPTSRHSYLARDTRLNLTAEQKKHSKSKVGRVRIFNSQALWNSQKPVFVVEGEIDALSIIDVGGEAVALGSTANRKALIAMLENQKPSQPLIIAMDNDDAGRRTNQKLIKGLEMLEIQFYTLDISYPYKDANEALNANRDAFTAIIEQAENIESEILRVEREQLKKETVSYYLDDFLKNIEESKKASFFPTGFSDLDNILDGGLYSGLYVVGAISSLGKTTFCLQIADQIASLGQDVLIFSLEMARSELIAKSISRLTLIKNFAKNGTTNYAKTTRGILTGKHYKNYDYNERELIQGAIDDYRQYGDNIYITEGIGNIGVDEIKDKIHRHVKLTGKAPVVVIDYLQIIAPSDIRATDKQNTDKAVLGLKRLSRDYDIPVIGISSFNRDNYIAPVNLASFKESGAIEYSSDVLVGLQYEGMDYQEGETDKDRQKRIRELIKTAEQRGRNGQAQSIQVKILKNRNGSKGDTFLDFYPMFNCFTKQKERVLCGDDSENWTKVSSQYRI